MKSTLNANKERRLEHWGELPASGAQAENSNEATDDQFEGTHNHG